MTLSSSWLHIWGFVLASYSLTSLWIIALAFLAIRRFNHASRRLALLKKSSAVKEQTPS
ncbi:hypothetical protein GS501_02650 [Saccharibacter sp. 17.LH.SD]|uniref:hypothetical protein n=1 Tax=Saccharibacter sp. 17.LH.SD TaxID=2689393 RepID=UPI0013680BCC|nr:hypothetical protein [Saccharibacter sp. 17.LH.SD]MXV43953.1 hypothetical protein [Saccharibacter sp. 17.LH.SD]